MLLFWCPSVVVIVVTQRKVKFLAAYVKSLGTIENHRNTEITETVIFVKCRESRDCDFAKKCRVFAIFGQNAVVLRFLTRIICF